MALEKVTRERKDPRLGTVKQTYWVRKNVKPTNAHTKKPPTKLEISARRSNGEATPSTQETFQVFTEKMGSKSPPRQGPEVGQSEALFTVAKAGIEPVDYSDFDLVKLPVSGGKQGHGKVLEQFLARVFWPKAHLDSDPTRLWDVPAVENNGSALIPAELAGLPVSIKVRRSNRNNLEMADAVRQRDISEPFLLVHAKYAKRNFEQRITELRHTVVSVSDWQQFWGPVTKRLVGEFDSLAKDRSISYREAREQCKQWKNDNHALLSQSSIQLNAKISADKNGSLGDRRVQCSLNGEHLEHYFSSNLTLFNQPLPRLQFVFDEDAI